MSKKKAAPGPPPTSEPELQRYHARFVLALNAAKSGLQWLIVGTAVCVVAYVTFYLPVAVSHGETTTISVMQTWAANVNASVWFSWAATGACGGSALYMRRRWVKERTEKDARIKALETQIDANRTSSQVNQAGDPV